MTPFDFINAINTTKTEFEDYSEYLPFLTNKSLSFFPDTIALANQMNMNHHLPKDLQFHFLLNTVRKQKRFVGKWPKHEISDVVKLVSSHYRMSYQKARQAVASMSHEQIEQLKETTKQGG